MIMVSGLLVASDGVKRKGILDILNIPFYGGNKYLMRDKILSPNICLMNGEPLISAPIKALADANTIHDFVIVGESDQCEQLESIAKTYSPHKPFMVVENQGNIGDALQHGAEHASSSDCLFVLQPDLPFVTGTAIDDVFSTPLPENKLGASITFFMVSQTLFSRDTSGWQRTFNQLTYETTRDRYRFLDYIFLDPAQINPAFIRQVYASRMINSLSGKVHALLQTPSIILTLGFHYLRGTLSFHDLENRGSLLNGSAIKFVEATAPSSVVFLKDIDTPRDYQQYLQTRKL